MIFGETYDEAERRRLNWQKEQRKPRWWFAWYPVKVEGTGGQYCWLEWVRVSRQFPANNSYSRGWKEYRRSAEPVSRLTIES